MCEGLRGAKGPACQRQHACRRSAASPSCGGHPAPLARSRRSSSSSSSSISPTATAAAAALVGRLVRGAARGRFSLGSDGLSHPVLPLSTSSSSRLLPGRPPRGALRPSSTPLRLRLRLRRWIQLPAAVPSAPSSPSLRPAAPSRRWLVRAAAAAAAAAAARRGGAAREWSQRGHCARSSRGCSRRRPSRCCGTGGPG